MAKEGTDEQPNLPIKMTVKNKLEHIWEKVTSKSNELARRSNHVARLMDASKPTKIPTKLELCLFICSTFPGFARISVDDLVIYMMGLNSFEDGVHDTTEARNLIHDIIHDLTTRYMIELCGGDRRTGASDHEIRLDFSFSEEEILIQHEFDNAGWLLNELRREKSEYDNQYVKMLDEGRDLAKLIASKYGLVFGCETLTKNWLFMHDYEDYNALSLVLKEVISKYSNYAYCPKLALLHVQYSKDSQCFSVGVFIQLQNLQVLSLDIPSLTQPLVVHRNLRTLRLKVVKLDDMYWIGCLKYLEFLSISTLSLRYISKEMKKLRNLRLLDLRESTNLVYIPPGVLSRMSKLEELYLPLSYKRWGCRGKDDDDHECFESEEAEKMINASFSEIASLFLYALQISLQEASILPKKTSIFKRIQRFRILIHNDFRYQPLGEGRMNKLQLTGDARDLKQSGIWNLMRRVEDLSLIRVRNLKNVMSQLEEFLQLKKMIITNCDELEYLVVTAENWIPNNLFSVLKYLHLSMLSNLKEIWQWHGTRPRFGGFENLRQINIRFCHKLKHVFPLSVAKGLRRLKSVEILDCNEMEGVLYGNEEGDDNPNEACSIEELHLYSLPKFVGFLSSMTTNEVSPATKSKDAISLMEMYCAFSSKLMQKRLGSLTKLKIAFCGALRIIFSFKENHARIRVLNSLKVLELYGLQNLRHIWFRIPPKIPAIWNLQHLVLSECHNLLYVFPYRVAKLLVQLKKVQINCCEKIEEIVAKDDDDEAEAMMDTILLFHLKVLELRYMPNLRVFTEGLV